MAKKTTKKTTPKKPVVKKTGPRKAAPKRGLGRGLSALMEDVSMSTFISDDVLLVDDISDSPDIIDDISAAPQDDIETDGAPLETKEITPPETKSDDEPENRYRLEDYPTLTPEESAAAHEEFRQKTIKEHGVDPDNLTHNAWGDPIDRSNQLPADHNVASGVTFVSMGQLERNPEQPRRHFDGELLKELSDSIAQKGILQPILVRPLPGREARNQPVYQVVAGERRWQAAMMARLDSMPVFIREITDQEALEIGVIENVQRAELNPMEEAMAYKALVNQFGRTQEDVAQAVGKSRSYVANMMRLINLPEQVQDYLARGDISTGHARAIIAAPDPVQMAAAIVENNLSVRDAEDWARKLKTNLTAPKVMPKGVKGADERRLEAQLMDALGLSVDLKHKGPGGELRVKYKTADQLDEIVLRLMGKV